MRTGPDYAIATCHGCEGDIISGDGIVIAADETRWHPDCRAKALDETVPVPKRRGRPPKALTNEEAG